MNAHERPLIGRVALVTGAGRARGMGAATAMQLGRLGATVFVTDVARKRSDLEAMNVGLGDSPEALAAVADDVTSTTGSRCIPMALDITDSDQVAAAVARVVEEFGAIDILVNNAGTAVGIGDFLDVPDSAWELAWNVNVLGAVKLSRSVIPHMPESGGAIVNVASTAGLIGIAGYGAYNVTKHAMVGLTRLLAAELGPRGIRVNGVAPGFIHTDMGAAELEMLADESGKSLHDVTDEAVATVPLRRLGTAEDVAEVVAWLASGAQYVTGSVISIDGGSGR